MPTLCVTAINLCPSCHFFLGSAGGQGSAPSLHCPFPIPPKNVPQHLHPSSFCLVGEILMLHLHFLLIFIQGLFYAPFLLLYCISFKLQCTCGSFDRSVFHTTLTCGIGAHRHLAPHPTTHMWV